MDDASRRLAENPADRGAVSRWGTRIAVFMAMFQFVGLAVSAGFWWWAMPGGFPVTHPRFAMNQLTPLVFLVTGLIAVGSCLSARFAIVRNCQRFLLTTTCVAGVTGACLYPLSMMGLKLLFVAGGMLFGVGLVSGLVFRFVPRSPVSRWILLPATVLGIFLPWSQRGWPPATQPVGHALRKLDLQSTDVRPAPLSLGEHFGVQPTSGAVMARRGNLTLLAEPLLTFISISPDRFWTLFSPRRPAPHRRAAAQRSGNDFRAEYLSDHWSQLIVRATNETLHVDAQSELKTPVYSHLNTYVRFQFHADQAVAIAFSPCPERLAVLPSDYPVGRPARFACRKAAGGFEVVEASSGEKGPFQTLASGNLARGEPLVLTLFNGEAAAFEILLADWSAQASTQLSPTAGWGMPENAIEFSLSDSGHVALIHVTLAGTSVGRGWDSVGHAPGVYRNRMTVRVLPE